MLQIDKELKLKRVKYVSKLTQLDLEDLYKVILIFAKSMSILVPV